ncbi:MAG: hypothetical protein AAFR55_08155 [Pseudomonadota bacterium]
MAQKPTTRRFVIGRLTGALAGTCAVLVSSFAAHAQSDRPKMDLELVGKLSCSAKLTDESEGLGLYALTCDYVDRDRPNTKITVGGELVGTNTFLDGADNSTVQIAVYAPSTTIDAVEMNGDYDRGTNRAYGLPGGAEASEFLFGGTNDLVVLRPEGALAGALTPSVRMTLTVKAPLGLRATQ